MRIGIFPERNHIALDQHVKYYKLFHGIFFTWHSVFSGLFLIKYKMGWTRWHIGIINIRILT